MRCSYVQITFFNPDGLRLTTTNRTGRIRWARSLNKIGSAEVLLSLKEFDYDTYARCDLMMAIEYGSSAGNLKLAGNTIWFLTGWTETGGLNQEETLLLRFEDAMTLLDRRIVAYKADIPAGSSPQSKVNELAGDALVRIFRENLGDLTGPERSLTPRVNFVPSGLATPQISKDIQFKNVLSVMTEIARTSRDKGLPLYFDLVPQIDQNQVTFTFQTFVQQRGNDRRDYGIIRSNDPLFALTAFEADCKYPNSAYAAGSGRGRDRLVENVTNGRATESFFARREEFKSVQTGSQQTLRDEASEIVNNVAGRFTISGELLGEVGERYDFGDRLLLSHRNQTFDAEVSAWNGTWENGVHQDQILVRSRE